MTVPDLFGEEGELSLTKDDDTIRKREEGSVGDSLRKHPFLLALRR